MGGGGPEIIQNPKIGLLKKRKMGDDCCFMYIYYIRNNTLSDQTKPNKILAQEFDFIILYIQIRSCIVYM